MKAQHIDQLAAHGPTLSASFECFINKNGRKKEVQHAKQAHLQISTEQTPSQSWQSCQEIPTNIVGKIKSKLCKRNLTSSNDGQISNKLHGYPGPRKCHWTLLCAFYNNSKVQSNVHAIVVYSSIKSKVILKLMVIKIQSDFASVDTLSHALTLSYLESGYITAKRRNHVTPTKSSQHTKSLFLLHILQPSMLQVPSCHAAKKPTRDSKSQGRVSQEKKKCYLGSLHSKVITFTHLSKMVGHPSLWIHLINANSRTQKHLKRYQGHIKLSQCTKTFQSRNTFMTSSK